MIFGKSKLPMDPGSFSAVKGRNTLMGAPQTVPHSKRTEVSLNANSDIRLVDETAQPKTFRDKSAKLTLNAKLRKH